MFAFIPMKLSVPDRPELSVFSHNVLFVKRRVENDKIITGSAVYIPDIGSYARIGYIQTLDYHNKYGPSDWLRISYDSVKQAYAGEKFIKGESVGRAMGTGWSSFFFQFSRLGVVEGEHCLFDGGATTVS